jgi:hypothetical protein
MALVDIDFESIRERIRTAYLKDKEVLNQHRNMAAQLKSLLQPIAASEKNFVTVVSADGGNNSFYFNPAGISLVRVADSVGRLYMTDALPSTMTVVEFSQRRILMT